MKPSVDVILLGSCGNNELVPFPSLKTYTHISHNATLTSSDLWLFRLTTFKQINAATVINTHLIYIL